MTKSKRRWGGHRKGAGRPKLPKFNPQHGEYLIFQQEEIGGEIQPDKLAKVIGVSDDELEFQIGDTVYVIRRPNDTDQVVLK